MKRSQWIFACLVAVLVGMGLPALAQDVAYEKYELPNGLTVIMHEDHSVPSVAINTWFYVGAKDEADRRSGFAHLFEHLMFMGTRRVPGSDFDNVMEAGGGYNNASTSEDRTNYYSLGPSELLPTLLWLDADRLEDLGKEMTQEKLDKQRAVVRNERRQNYENRPYGKADLLVPQLMYPKGHPYHLSVIGSHEDLEAATLEDVKSFFATYYLPANASLVVAGDFDPEQVKPLIADWFGTLKRGSDVDHASARPVELDRVKRLTLTDAVQYAKTRLVYHSPPYYGTGDSEMDLIALILTNGISSRLYQRLVYQEELAVEVSAYQSSQLLQSLFYIDATARPGVELERIEQAIDEVLAEFVAQGPTAEELEKQKAQIEFATIARLQSLRGKADALNRYQFYFDEPNSFKRDLDRFRDANADDVKSWAGKVLTPDARLILRVIPEIEVPEPNPREEQPTIAGAPAFTPPLPATFKLKNGITVHHWERHELPLVQMTMLLPVGSSSDPADKAGLANLPAGMLDEGAGERSAIEFSDALDLLGASFGASSSRDYSTVTLSSLTRNFDAALTLFGDAVRQPRFDEKEWERVHSLHVQGLLRDQDQPNSVATNVALRAYFGDDHAYSRPGAGTPETAGSVTLDDARAYHARLFRPDGAVILSAGDIGADTLKQQLNATLGDWKKSRGAKPVVRPAFPQPANDELRVAIVNRPGAVQTVIRFVMPAPLYGDPKRIEYELFRTILGGGFTSRLNQNLREDKGYTYGAGCVYSMQSDVGFMLAYSSVRADVTGEAVGEFLKEFNAIRGGDISDDEARKARSAGRMDTIESFAGLGGIIGAATTLVRNDRPFSDLGEELTAVAAVTRDDLNGVAGQAVPLENGLLLLVGDKAQILPQLEGLGLPTPIELSVEGNQVHEETTQKAARGH